MRKRLKFEPEFESVEADISRAKTGTRGHGRDVAAMRQCSRSRPRTLKASIYTEREDFYCVLFMY